MYNTLETKTVFGVLQIAGFGRTCLGYLDKIQILGSYWMTDM